MDRSRKERSDKKRQITCSITVEVYETITKISYICDLPLKTVAESLCIETIQNKSVLESLNEHFRRSFTYGNVTYCGDMSRKPFRIQYKNLDTRKIHMRFRQDVYERISVLSYALDCSTSTAAAVLLESAAQVRNIIVSVIARFVSPQIDYKRRSQLRELLRFIRDNEDTNHETSLARFINVVLEECFDKTITLKTAIRDYLD